MWALLLATSSGSSVATIKLATEILKDNNKVATAPLLATFVYLAERDTDLQREAERIKRVVQYLTANEPLVNVDAFISYLEENVSSHEILKKL